MKNKVTCSKSEFRMKCYRAPVILVCPRDEFDESMFGAMEYLFDGAVWCSNKCVSSAPGAVGVATEPEAPRRVRCESEIVIWQRVV